MKFGFFVILLLCMFCNFGCNDVEYIYRVNISTQEKELLKKYNRKNNDLKNVVSIKGDYIYSNDRNILKKIKIRAAGLMYHNQGAFVPIHITDNGKYYYVLYSDELRNMNWLNEKKILNVFSDTRFIHEIDLEEYDGVIEFDLERDEFINKYLVKVDDGKYRPSIDRRVELFKSDQADIHVAILLLSQIKYELMLMNTRDCQGGGWVTLIEPNIEEVK